MFEVDHAAIAAIVMLALVVVELAKIVVNKFNKKNGCGVLTRDQQNKLDSIFEILNEKDDDKVLSCYTPRSYGETLKEIQKAVNSNTAISRDMKSILEKIERKIK